MGEVGCILLLTGGLVVVRSGFGRVESTGPSYKTSEGVRREQRIPGTWLPAVDYSPLTPSS